MKRNLVKDIVSEVKDTIEKYSMFEDVNRAVIGFSAGPDSVCLLDILKKLYGEKIDFHLVYINHGLRPKSILKTEEDLTKLYARRFKCGYKIIKIKIPKTKKGLEAEARERRYSALLGYLNEINAQRIILGHNLDDLIETFFLNLIRGSGARGLSSIPPVRLPIVRPLIEIKKEEIINYLKINGLRFSTDITNKNIALRRNLLRHKIIPELLKINPSLFEVIKREIELIKMDNDYLQSQAEKVFARVVEKRENSFTLDLRKIIRYNKSIINRVVMEIIKNLNGSIQGFTSEHIEAILSLKDRTSGSRVILPKGIIAQKGYDKIYIGRTKDSPPFYLEIGLNDDKILNGLRIKTAVLSKVSKLKIKNSEFFDLSEIRLPIFIRNRRPGDFIEIKDGRLKLKKVLNEAKIPIYERNRPNLLCDQRGILWVIGLRRAYRALVNKMTKKILKVEFEYLDKRS
ncbi:MAG: tRNA lysidine(34) synthetase TilS [candidate division WOR-3 bacterium]